MMQQRGEKGNGLLAASAGVFGISLLEVGVLWVLMLTFCSGLGLGSSN